MLAAMNGHTAAVKLLLDMGSDINAQIETNRNTALTLACFQGRTEVVSLLLDRKANVEHRAKVRKSSKFVHGFIGLIFKVSSSNMLNIILVFASNIYHSVELIQTLTLENTSTNLELIMTLEFLAENMYHYERVIKYHYESTIKYHYESASYMSNACLHLTDFFPNKLSLGRIIFF